MLNSNPTGTPRFRLLLVDDQPSNLQVLGSVLADDYDILVATSGLQALELAQGSKTPDLILLDVIMPEMDGHEVCRRLKEKPKTANIPIIFVTGLDQDEDLQQGFELGAEDYITKPIKPRVVQARVHNQLKLLLKTRELEAANTALQNSNKELEQFAYAISHDLRQPLRMISSYLGLLQRSLKGQLKPDQEQFIRTAVQSSQRLDEMVLGLLNYSRIGRVNANKASLATRESLQEALIFLHTDIEAQEAQLDIKGDWPEITANKNELTRLFQNLISNALKYIEKGEKARVAIRSEVTPEHWQVKIHDQGIGIDPEQQERLFKVFSRLHTREQYEGNGVGLALCRKIVEHHQGVIGVESEGEGKGSTFWFQLPFKQGE